ncbi:ankyrin repeat domain-containing protein [Pelomyxa schiedti]|nr:ankyrin repeat domain-containing protein [Pelomyxa schiedti]
MRASQAAQRTTKDDGYARYEGDKEFNEDVMSITADTERFMEPDMRATMRTAVDLSSANPQSPGAHEMLQWPWVCALMLERDRRWLSCPFADGMPPLLVACKCRFVKTVRYLVEARGCDVNIRDENRGFSPLHVACTFGSEKIAYLFIKKYNADVDIRDNSWMTPLATASTHNYLSIVKMLVQIGNANPTLRDKRGYTPADIAKMNRNDDTAFFLEHCSPMLVKENPPPPVGLERNAPLVPENVEMSSIAIRLVCCHKTHCGTDLLSGKDCLSCSQVCAMWRQQLSADDSIWIPHITKEIGNAVRNTIDYQDSIIPHCAKQAWREATLGFNKQKMNTLKTWSTTAPEKFFGNSKVRYLWIMRKKGRVPMPDTDVPRYNPLVHHKWWHPKDVALCLWCYIWHYQWLSFFIKQSVTMAHSYDSKVLASVRNSLGAFGMAFTLLLGFKFLSIPTLDKCTTLSVAQNFLSTSFIFSMMCALILYAFSLSNRKDIVYWFPVTIFILGIVPFPSEWICLFNSITNPYPTFMAVASVLFCSSFLFSKYYMKVPDIRRSVVHGILGATIGTLLLYDRFLVVLRMVAVPQLLLRNSYCYPEYDITWLRHKMTLCACLVLLLIAITLVVIF